MQSKHILLLPSWYPANTKDIRGSFFREQALALVRAGYQVGVVTSELRSLKNWKSIFSLNHGCFYENDQGINTFRFRTMYWFPKLYKLINQLSFFGGVLALENYIKKFGKPDLIHVHSCLYMGRVAQYAKRKYGIKYVVTEHSSGYVRKIYNAYLLNYTKNILQHSSKNIAVSKDMANFFKKTLTPNLTDWVTIPNIVNPLFFQNPLYEKDKNNNVFINVAFMNKNKKQINIVKAIEGLRDQGINNIKLLLIGDGTERYRIEEYIKEKKLTNIECLGLLSREDVVKLMAKSDFFVLSSDFETFGVVAIEALACGLPVVSTKCGGPEDIVNPSNGLLVDKDNVPSLQEGLQNIMDINYDFGKIRQDCYAQYSEKAVVEKLNQIYVEVLDL